ncbi:MAG: InlB B-repeat-containing protein, partial [Candidatus Pacebacteria bacterium]|nr:InlB B-repeat-containing protein [Candidatus Paceibacterota bacterium]
MKVKSIIFLGVILLALVVSGTTRTFAATCSSASASAPTVRGISGTFRLYAYGVSWDVLNVMFPVWGDNNGQNDIVWYQGYNQGGGTWYADVNLANHNDASGYPEYAGFSSHVYMYAQVKDPPPIWCGTANFARYLPNDSICDFSSPPTDLTPGQTFSLNISMINSGQSTWKTGHNFNLGSQNGHDNMTWGTNRMSLVSSSVSPANFGSFNGNFTAPSTPGVYTFDWKTVQDGMEWFGGTCSRNVAVNCPLPWGGILAPSTGMTAYQSSFPAGSCVSETRNCVSGSGLSGSYTNQFCVAGCLGTPWGDLAHGQQRTGYANAAPAGACASETRTCNFGSLLGTYAATSCTPGCTGTPWGNVSSGYSDTAYAASYADVCSSQVRTCSAGTMSGSYTITTGCTVNSYSITFNSNGGSAVSTITQAYGSTITPPANPTRAGYTFTGWSPALASTMPSGGQALTAQWSVNNYSVTFNSNGGSAVSTITQAYGSTITPPANPTRSGYTFTGWSPALAGTMPIGGQALTAQWSVNNYSITFNSNGGSAVSTITQAYGSTITPPANPTRAGYTFTGWSPALAGTMPSGGQALTAQWSVNNYSVTFNSNGGSAVSTITQAYGSAITPPANPTRSGYTFTGWSPALAGTMPIGGQALTAQWSDTTGPSTPGTMTASWTGDHYVKTDFTANTSGSTDSGSGIRGYKLCRSHDNAGGCSVWTASGEHAGTSEVVSGGDLPSDGAYRYYYWYAYDNAGNQSANSNGEYIRRDTSAPSVTDISATNVAKGGTARFYVSASDGGSGLQTGNALFYLGTYPYSSWNKVNGGTMTWNGSQYYYDVTLNESYSTQYRAFSYVYDNLNNQGSRDENPTEFTITNTAPPISTLVSPANTAVLTGNGTSNVTFTTNIVTDVDGQTPQYYFRVTTGADAETGVVCNSGWQTGTSYTCAPGYGTFYWHVYTYDGVTQTNPNYVWSFTINKASQATLTTTAQTVTYPTTFSALSTTGGSGSGAVSYVVTSAGTAGCSVIGTTLSYTSAGTCTVTATKAADTNYLVTSSAAQTFTVNKGTQGALTVTNTTSTYGSGLTLSSSGGSGGGAVTYALVAAGTANCSVTSGGVVTFTAAGTCTVNATKAADTNYNAITSANATVTINQASQATLTTTAQTVTYPTTFSALSTT